MQKTWLNGSLIGINISGSAQATLIDRGDGMIYDDVLDVTWLQDANYAQTSGYDADGRMTWEDANAWAAGLNYGGYNDWRLPDVQPVDDVAINYNLSYDGSTDRGYNITSRQSEMAYMFHINLVNLSSYQTDGTLRSGSGGVNWGVTNMGLFTNLKNSIYWSEVEYALNPSIAWAFETSVGFQNFYSMSSRFYAWAVRSGDVVGNAPAPTIPAMLLTGLAATALRRKR